MSELFANPPVPGTASPLTTLAAAITTTPVAGTVESWAVNAAAPVNLRSASAGQQFRVVIDSEVMIVAASASGASPWSFTRGAEGSTIATHLVNAPINHLVTQGSLGTFVQSSTQGLTITGTPSAGQVPTATSSTAANWQNPSGGGGSSLPAGVIWLQDPSLPGGAADNTGAAYCDQQFVAAIARAQAIIAANPAGLPPPIISGLAGTYKLGQFASIGVNAKVKFGGFGGGADQCARFSFPTETGYPTVMGMIESYTGGSTSLVVTHQKNAFAPASVAHPQPFVTSGGHLYWYSGVTGSVPSQTLTMTAALPDATFSGVKYPITANSAFVCAGGQDGYTFDHTCSLIGPSSGSRATWHPSTTLNGAATLPLATIPLVSTSGFPTSGEVMIVDSTKFKAAVTYTGVSGNSLTGCAVRGGGTYAFSSGTDVIYITPPTAMDGVSLGNRGGVDCFMYGWRNAVVMYSDHESIGPNFYPLSSDNYLCVESWPDYNITQAYTSGNQSIAGVSDIQGAFWSAVYVTACTQLLKTTFGGGHTMGMCGWAFWKESTLGKTGAVAGLMQGATINDVAFEGTGLGVMGDPDSNSAASFTMVGCQIYQDGSFASAKYVAEFAINASFSMVDASSLIAGGPLGGVGNAPFFFADQVNGTMDAPASAVATMIARRVNVGQCPRLSNNQPNWRVAFPGGVWTNVMSTVTTGALITAVGQQTASNPSSTPLCYVSADDGTGALAGVIVAVLGQGGVSVGIAATSYLWGPVSVNCATGAITSGNWVRGNGAASAGTAVRASGLGDTTAQLFARAVGSESGGKALIVITPALS